MPTSITPQAQIEYLATKVMGWELRNYEQDRPAVDAADREDAFNNDGWGWEGRESDEEAYQWNPLKSWDNWREVEERVMEDGKLWMGYLLQFAPVESNPHIVINSALRADLPTRVSALIAAHSLLSK